MLYSNEDLKSAEKRMDFGTIHSVSMGETGRGRKEMSLVCPEGTILKKGNNPEYTIGTTKTGRPRINKSADDQVFLMLSSKAGYTRRGSGTISVLKSQAENFEVIATGNGADGDAGRIGSWTCALIKSKSNGLVKVRPGGHGYGLKSQLFLINNGKVYNIEISELEECCEKLGIEIPCTIVNEDSRQCYLGNEWMEI